MKKIITLVCTLLLLVSFLQSSAKGTDKKEQKTFTPGWAIGVKFNTFGPGLEIVKSFNELVNLRVGGTYMTMHYNYTVEDEISTIKKINITTGSISVLADLNFLSFMHFTGGLLYNINKVEMLATPKEEYYIGEVLITPETIGDITYRLTPNKLCPYAGLGFGRNISGSGVVSFAFDFGAVYHGTPKVYLDANGMLSPTASQEQQEILEDNVRAYKFYPVLNFQLSFRFYKSKKK